MRTGLTISGVGHAAVLLWCVVTFVARPYHAGTSEALPVDVISTSELAQITKGTKNAPPVEKPKPVAEKVAAPAPVDDPLAKLANKEIKAATDVPPVPERKPPEPKAKKPPQPQADPIADALKKDDDKKPDPKKPDPKPPTPPKKPAQQEPPPFDPRNVQALLDKRTPQRMAMVGDEIGNNKLSLGGPNQSAEQLSQSELGALRDRLQNLWNLPAGNKDPRELTVEVEIQLKPDGTLAAPPTVLTQGSSPLFQAARDSARRAVYQGQPYTMLRPEHYELWKDVIVTFDPQYIGRY
ncbi:MAG TPA: protein TolA [Xanthobacteraceae bacterium]